MEQQDEFLVQKRLMDLSRMADRKGIVLYSNFLNQYELHVFQKIKADIRTEYQVFGGYEYAERQMIAFIPDALSYTFPIACLRFYPLHPKFAEDLTHRDILGALMHLGLERSRIGDIKADGQNYYIFCEEGIAGFLLESLVQIRHTAVKGERSRDTAVITQKFEYCGGIVSSDRLDSIVAFAVKKSRSQSAALIQSQKVFVNDCVMTSNSYPCREGDRISIRGFGKYIYEGSSGETRKGRMKITLKKYL